MNFLHSEVDVTGDEAIRVDLDGTEANVLVMDSLNFSAYQRGGRFRYLGGHYNVSPVLIRPQQGHWHVVVDLGGRRGHVRAAVSVVPA